MPMHTHSYYPIPCRLGEELYNIIGSGHFGSIQKAREGPTEVAVKTLKPGLSERERVKFLQAWRVYTAAMTSIHPNSTPPAIIPYPW